MRDPLTPSVLVVFGTTGDLMARKVVPSLLFLWQRGLLPDRFRVVGFGRRDWTDETLREHVRGILQDCCTDGMTQDELEEFLRLFCYQYGQFNELDTFEATAEHLARIDAAWDYCSNKLFYLAVPPEYYGTILGNLAESGLTKRCSPEEGWTRVLVEKPFGDDEASSRELDAVLGSLFREQQVYRIDHYLAKEMLQGILNFRFQNNLFETEWNRNAIESIEITLLESLGVEGRGAFYDGVGALRDVGQNHLLQMLALMTMDQPATSEADDIRASRAAAIAALTPPTRGDVADCSFRAQYDGYREVKGVADDSQTETYFMLRTVLTGERWAGVPVTIQSGKRLGASRKEIVVNFKHPSACLCDHGEHPENRVVFSLEPKDAITIDFLAKKPGFDDDTEERSLNFFLYEKEEKQQYVEEYAKLLYDAFRGDQTLFVSTDEVEASWRFIDPWVDAWSTGVPALEAYPPGNDEVVGAAMRALGRPGRSGEIGVAGLGKMGAGIARNLLDDGWRVVGWNRTHSRAEAMASDGLEPVETIRELAAELTPPRAIWVMVPAGDPVDELLFGEGGLTEVLEPGDIVIDGGNTFFRDDPPRAEKLAEHGLAFLDIGTSGGPAGARYGACLMIGGDAEAYERLEPVFADIAVPGGYAYFGPAGAGHFVKMIHNGIEYGMMQAIAEGFTIMREGPYELDLESVARVYQNGSVIESRLVGWLQDAYGELGDALDDVSGVVGHTGEGEWTVQTAEALDVAAPVITEAFEFRVGSEEWPSYTGQVLTAMRNAFGGHGLGPGGGPRR